MFLKFLWEAPEIYVTWVVVAAFSICVHEVAHAWVAAREGDLTAWHLGYLTLNPLKVMGPMSLALLVLFGFAWGAVPVNPRAVRGRYGMARVSAAGPAANLLLACVFGVAFAVLAVFAGEQAMARPFLLVSHVGCQVNFFLLLFNLLPVPPLDGWSVLCELSTAVRQRAAAMGGGVGMIALVLVLVSPIGGGVQWLAEWMAVRLIGAVGLALRLLT